MLSITRTTFSNYENNTTHPPAEIAALIASYFQVTLYEIMLTDIEAEHIEPEYYGFLANNQTLIVAGHQIPSLTRIIQGLLSDVAILEDHLLKCT